MKRTKKNWRLTDHHALLDTRAEANVHGLNVSPRSGEALPAGWTAHLAPDGHIFFADAVSGRTQWARPPEQLQGGAETTLGYDREVAAVPEGSAHGEASAPPIQNQGCAAGRPRGRGTAASSPPSYESLRLDSSSLAYDLTFPALREHNYGGAQGGGVLGASGRFEVTTSPAGTTLRADMEAFDHLPRTSLGTFTNVDSETVRAEKLSLKRARRNVPLRADASSGRAMPYVSGATKKALPNSPNVDGGIAVSASAQKVSSTGLNKSAQLTGSGVGDLRGAQKSSGSVALSLPVLPAFFELEAARRRAKELAEPKGGAHSLATHKPSPFRGTADRPQPPLEGGSVGPSFYGSEQRLNPRRVPSTAVQFWSKHPRAAPVAVDMGLSLLSFDLPHSDNFGVDDSSVALAPGSAAVAGETRSLLQGTALLPDTSRGDGIGPGGEARAHSAGGTSRASLDAEGLKPSSGNALRLVSLKGAPELWLDENRSQLARPLGPAMLVNGLDGSQLSGPAWLLERARSSVAATSGPDFAEALLTAPAFRHGFLAADQLADVDEVRRLLGRLPRPEGSQDFALGPRLFAFSTDSHEAAWVIQRLWRKRQLRRGEAQTLIRRAYEGAKARWEFAAAKRTSEAATIVLGKAFQRHLATSRDRGAREFSAVAMLQAVMRGKVARARQARAKRDKYMRAALTLTMMLKARARMLRKKRRRQALARQAAVHLQSWCRGILWRKQLRFMNLAQKWFAHRWRSHFMRRYGAAAVTLQRRARSFLLGRRVRVLQCMGRKWLARRSAERRLAVVLDAEEARAQAEAAFVARAVEQEVGALADSHEGLGMFRGVLDGSSGRQARRDLGRMLFLREGEIKDRYLNSLAAQSPPGEQPPPSADEKLRREVRALLRIGFADGREADGVAGKAVREKMREKRKKEEAKVKAEKKKKQDAKKQKTAKKKAEKKKRAAARKAQEAKDRKAGREPAPIEDDEDEDQEEEEEEEDTPLEPNNESFHWFTLFVDEGPPPREPKTDEELDEEEESFAAAKLAAAIKDPKKNPKVDGVLTKAEKDAFRVARKEMKENWKKYNQVLAQLDYALCRDVVRVDGSGSPVPPIKPKSKPCGAVDIHALRIVLAAVGATGVTDQEILHVMHAYEPVNIRTPAEILADEKREAQRAQNAELKASLAAQITARADAVLDRIEADIFEADILPVAIADHEAYLAAVEAEAAVTRAAVAEAERNEAVAASIELVLTAIDHALDDIWARADGASRVLLRVVAVVEAEGEPLAVPNVVAALVDQVEERHRAEIEAILRPADVWVGSQDKEGHPCWLNETTGEFTYEDPTAEAGLDPTTQNAGDSSPRGVVGEEGAIRSVGEEDPESADAALAVNPKVNSDAGTPCDGTELIDGNAKEAVVAHTDEDADENTAEVELPLPNKKEKKKPFVNTRGFVAADERLVLGISQLARAYLNGTNSAEVATAPTSKKGNKLGTWLEAATRTVPIGGPPSSVFSNAARLEHLRILRDGAFVKATVSYRRRFRPLWACPNCLEAFALYGQMDRHVSSSMCARRAPSLGPDHADAHLVAIWRLATEGQRPALGDPSSTQQTSNQGSVGFGPRNGGGGGSSSSKDANKRFGSAASRTVLKAQSRSDPADTEAATRRPESRHSEAARRKGFWDPLGGLSSRRGACLSGVVYQPPRHMPANGAPHV